MSTVTHIASDPGHGHGRNPADNYHPHILPLWQLAAVLGVLLVLTFLTVAATWVNLGEWNVVIAIGIAGLKATLVGAFFMHLYWDSRFNAAAILSAVAFVVLLIVLCSIDGGQYAQDNFGILKSAAADQIHLKAEPAAAAPAAAPAPAAAHK